jgi:hypothetical protein
MWPWIKRWRDWAMNDLWPLHRIGTQPQALHFSYEKAGLTLNDQPIPWNAEAVLVEASLRLPPAARQKSDFQLRKSDFQLRLPAGVLVPAESLRHDEDRERYHLFFRLKPPPETVTAAVLWRNSLLGQLTLPVLGRDEFISRLRLQLPTLFVRLGEQNVACQTFVARQCRGLIAVALLTSPTSLVPLRDLGLQVEFRPERPGPVHRVPAQLCSSQLAGRSALVTVAPPRFPRRIGGWVTTWLLGEQPLFAHRVRAISLTQFVRSLRISDTRFVIQTKDGVSVRRQVPPLVPGERIGPCFLVSSAEPGMAGVCNLQVRVQIPGAIPQPLLPMQEILITDGPTAVAPGTLDASDLARVSAFELRLRGKPLGVLSMSPVPTATFTAEGGFKAPANYAWSAAAEDELTERLNRLLEGKSNGERNGV